MPDFHKRSEKDELMDDPLLPGQSLIENLRELDWLNRYTGGHRISIDGIKKLGLRRNKRYTLVDVGCGSGDTMRYMAKWARKNGFSIDFTGIDSNASAIRHLQTHSRDFPEVKGRIADCFTFLAQTGRFDILHCSLFCHHLQDNELIRFFRLIREKINTGIVINDLKRSKMAYFSAWWFTRIMNGSRLSRHDGPLSVLKAFRRSELIDLLNRSGLNNFIIESRRPFRYLITINKTH